MTDEEIVRATGEFSYDVQTCRNRLLAGDDWQRTIQAHLFFDHILTKIIIEALQHPEHINLDRATFVAKLDLCAALGLVDDAMKGLLRRLNRLRNSISHDLSFRISDEDVQHLYDLSPEPARALIDEEVAKDGTRLFGTYLVNLILLDIARQRHAAHRLLREKQRRGLLAAMENARRVLAKVDPEKWGKKPRKRPARKSGDSG